MAKNINDKNNRERKMVVQRSVIKIYNKNHKQPAFVRPAMGILAQQARCGYIHNGKFFFL